jgi:hypothetical protein
MRRAVVDQPGLKIIVFGLLVSIFLGLTLRSQITQTKINDRLKKIVLEFEQKNKSKKLTVDFAEARLLLSDWGFPFPHLSIKNIKISSSASECVDNQIYIESLDIPFSWMKLFDRDDQQLDTVRAGLIELRIDNPDQCFTEVKLASQSEVHSYAKHETIEVNKQDHNQEIHQLRHLSLYVDKLKIIDKHNYNIPVVLQTVGIKIALDKNKLQAVDLKSQLYLFRDNEGSIYKFKSDFNLNYELKPGGQVEASGLIHGKLIDKPFEISMAYAPDVNKIFIKHTIKDLSVKALLSLNNYQNIRMRSQFDGISGLTISNQGAGEYNLSSKSLDFYKISDIVLSSGESTISAEAITVTSLKPLKFEPFKVLLNEFDLEKLKNIPAFVSIQKSIYDFGKISGTIFVNSESAILAEGFIKDIQFIFSNRGQRAYQKIDKLSYKATPRSLTIDSISMENQIAEGGLRLKFEPKTEHHPTQIEAQGEISNIKLNDSVYNIFSFNQSKPTTIALSLHADDNQVKSKLRFDQLASSAMEIKQLEVGYSARVDSIVGRLHDSVFEVFVKNLKIVRDETLDDSFYEVLDQLDHASNNDSSKRSTDFNFDMIKANYVKKDQGDVVINVTANYLSKSTNQKNNIHMQGEFTNPARSVFDIDVLSQGKMIQKFGVNADLGQYVFEIKK